MTEAKADRRDIDEAQEALSRLVVARDRDGMVHVPPDREHLVAGDADDDVAMALEGIARNPAAAGNIRTTLIIGLALIESLALYTLVVVFVRG